METNKQFYTPAEVRDIVHTELAQGYAYTPDDKRYSIKVEPLPGLRQRIPDYDHGVPVGGHWRVYRNGRVMNESLGVEATPVPLTLALLELPEEYRQAILKRYDA